MAAGAIVACCAMAAVPTLAVGAKPKPVAKPKPKPDLTVTATIPAQLNATTTPAGFSIGVKATKAAVGGGTVTKVYLSTNAKVDAKDTVVATVKMGAIAKGKTATVLVKPVVPAATFGSLFVLVCADSASKVVETNERNNCASRAAVPVDVVPPVATHASWIEGTPDSLFVIGTSLYFRSGAASTAAAQFAVTDAGMGVAAATSTDGNAVALNGGAATVTGAVMGKDFRLDVADAAGNTAFATAGMKTAGTISSNVIRVNSARLETTQVPFTFSPGTNAPIGLVGWYLQRATAPFTGSGTTCGAYGEYATIGAPNPASPYVDTVPGDGCYKYALVSVDNVGVTEVLKDTSIVRVQLPVIDTDEDE